MLKQVDGIQERSGKTWLRDLWSFMFAGWPILWQYAGPPQGLKPTTPDPVARIQPQELPEKRCNRFSIKPPGGQCILKYGHSGAHAYKINCKGGE